MKKSIILFIFLNLIVASGFSQTQRAYNNLIDKDYERATVLFLKVLDDNSLNATANFGMAMIYADDEYPANNLMTAWEYLLKAEQKLESISQDDKEILQDYFMNTDKRPRRYPVERKFEQRKDEVLDKLIKRIREANDLEFVYEILEKFPDFPKYQNTVHIRNYLEYRKAEKANTVEAFNTFIKDFPEAAQIPEAKENRDELIYEEVEMKNTVEAYNRFMKEHPDAKQFQQARMNKIHLEYTKAKEKNTVAALEQFIEQYPNALDLLEAKQELKQLIYKKAKKVNTLEAYNEFISKYPEGAQFIDIFNLKTAELAKAYHKNIKINRPVTWIRAFDNELQNDHAGKTIVADDGSFIISGNTCVNDTSNGNAWILSLDNEGKIKWNTIIGDVMHDQINIVATDQTGDIYAAGFANSRRDTFTGNAWIFKLKNNGSRQWNRILPFPEAYALAINDNDEIYIGGHSTDSLNYPSIIKISKTGKKLWQRTYITPGKIRSIKPADNNNVVIATDQWIFKLNELGYIEWECMLDSTETTTALKVLPNDEIIIAGHSENNSAWCRKYDKSSLLWNTKIPYKDDIQLNDITTSAITGNVYIGGSIDQWAVLLEVDERGKLKNNNNLMKKYHGGVHTVNITSNDNLILGLNGNIKMSGDDIVLMKLE